MTKKELLKKRDNLAIKAAKEKPHLCFGEGDCCRVSEEEMALFKAGWDARGEIAQQEAYKAELDAGLHKLREEKRRLVDALKFYGDEKSWVAIDINQFYTRNIISAADCSSITNKEKHQRLIGGKLARQVLKEVGE